MNTICEPPGRAGRPVASNPLRNRLVCLCSDAEFASLNAAKGKGSLSAYLRTLLFPTNRKDSLHSTQTVDSEPR